MHHIEGVHNPRLGASALHNKTSAKHHGLAGIFKAKTKQAGILCIRNCMQLVSQLRTTLGIGSDAKKEGLRKRVHAHPGRAGRSTCA